MRFTALLFVVILIFAFAGCDDPAYSEKDESGIYTYVPGQKYNHGDAVKFPDGTIHYWDDNATYGDSDSDPTGAHFVDKPPAPKSPASSKPTASTSSVPKSSPQPTPTPPAPAQQPPDPPYVPTPPAPESDPVTVVAAGDTAAVAPAPDAGECVISAAYSEEGLSLEPTVNAVDGDKWWYSLSEAWERLTDTIMLTFSAHPEAPETVAIQDGDTVKIGYGEESSVVLKETITVNEATPDVNVETSGTVTLTKEEDAVGSMDYSVSGSGNIVSTVDDPQTSIPENETELTPPQTLTPEDSVIVTDSGNSSQIDVYDEISID